MNVGFCTSINLLANGFYTGKGQIVISNDVVSINVNHFKTGFRPRGQKTIDCSCTVGIAENSDDFIGLVGWSWSSLIGRCRIDWTTEAVNFQAVRSI